MLRSVWLTYRLHRFEDPVLGTAGGAAGHRHLAGQQADDRPEHLQHLLAAERERGLRLAPLRRAHAALLGTPEGSASYARIGLAVLPPLVGLFLGVPVVAREIELRTTDLAWSLALRRSRWLLTRLLPMLAFALVALRGPGSSWARRLFSAIAVGRAVTGPDRGRLAGPDAGRPAAFMALGIGVLVGALVGRTMPALLVAAIVVLALERGRDAHVQGNDRASHTRVWVTQNNEGWRDGVGPIAYLDFGNFDPARPGKPASPGCASMTTRLQALDLQICGAYPDTAADDSPEANAFNDCQRRFETEHQWSLEVPASAYPVFQNVETILGFLIGGVALLLIFPVVARRRPG